MTPPMETRHAASTSLGYDILVRRAFHEQNRKFFSMMVDLGQRRWGLPPGAPTVSLMYGLSARRLP